MGGRRGPENPGETCAPPPTARSSMSFFEFNVSLWCAELTPYVFMGRLAEEGGSSPHPPPMTMARSTMSFVEFIAPLRYAEFIRCVFVREDGRDTLYGLSL